MSVTRRRAFGQARDYLTIHISHFDMTVMVPVASADRIGLRPVVNEAGAREVLAALTQAGTRELSDRWHTRLKQYQAQLEGGDIHELAAVARSLADREASRGLSTVESDLYRRVKRMMSSELMYALGVDRRQAEAYIEDGLAGSPDGPQGRCP